MSIKELVSTICKMRKYVIKLNRVELREFKDTYYKLPYRAYILDCLWEYVWGYKTLKEVKTDFKGKGYL